MTALQDFQVGVIFLEKSVNIGYWFSVKLHQLLSVLVPDDGTDKTTYETRVSSSTLLTAAEKTECQQVIDDHNVFIQREGRDYIPSYYGNTRELFRKFALLCSGYYVDSASHPNIEELYNTFVADESYLMSDEEEYKLNALLLEKLKAAQVELVTEIYTVHAQEQ